ncbi:MAG: hypothetical protein DSZ08_01260 [Sulfurovum sp.]|nr:MAG: hypothetical protein DSZ08_01260 [Sulfurovum sp.]
MFYFMLYTHYHSIKILNFKSKGKSMTTFTAYTFKGKRTAQEVLNKIEDSYSYGWIDDVAVISKDDLGRIRIHSTWAQDNLGETGLGWGALTGAILGLLAGPGGALASSAATAAAATSSEAALAGAAAGGSLWGLLGLTTDEAIDDPRLDEFGDQLHKDMSSLVLVTGEPYVDEYVNVMGPYQEAPYNGIIIQTNLDDDDIKYISKKIKQYS